MARNNRSGKVYVTVESKPDSDGWNIPFELTYNDEGFDIIDPIRSLKLFDNAARYKCKIDGKSIELFNEGEKWWIVR